MTSMMRIASALALSLAAAHTLAAEQYHGPTAPAQDDAAYYFEEAAPPVRAQTTLPYDFTRMKLDDSIAITPPPEGTQVRSRYDDTSMKFVEESSAHPMEQ